MKEEAPPLHAPEPVMPPGVEVERARARPLPRPDGPPAPRNFEQALAEVNGRLADIYFAYDRFDVAVDAIETLRQDGELLRAIFREFPSLKVTVEGHCDERGSAEYNLGLGDRRAMSVVKVLREFGLPEGNFAPVSYGKERPECIEMQESCWQRNRRVHFVARTGTS